MIFSHYTFGLGHETNFSPSPILFDSLILWWKQTTLSCLNQVGLSLISDRTSIGISFIDCAHYKFNYTRNRLDHRSLVSHNKLFSFPSKRKSFKAIEYSVLFFLKKILYYCTSKISPSIGYYGKKMQSFLFLFRWIGQKWALQ